MTNSLVCADASLALKLVLHGPDSELAHSLWEEWKAQQVTVIAPTLWGYEVTSVIRNRVHRGMLPPEVEEEVFVTVHQLPVQLMEPAGLHRRAWELARHFDRPAAYDAHYLALAEMAGCPFWTADERLFNAVREELEWVHWLGDYSSWGSENASRV
jgi:predicted nucleic acid-binding protein